MFQHSKINDASPHDHVIFSICPIFSSERIALIREAISFK